MNTTETAVLSGFGQKYGVGPLGVKVLLKKKKMMDSQ